MSQPAQDSRSVTTAILAGGAAARLGGVDKGLVVLQGQPLIGWVYDSLERDPENPCLIVANRNLETYSRYARTISDQAPEDFKGPLAGLVAALLACDTDWLFTVPVDCLQVPRGLAAALLDHASITDSRAVVAHDGERRQPLFGLYRRQLAESANTALEHGSGVSRWQDSVGARELIWADSGIEWFNLNTVEDIATMTENLQSHA